jgi:dynein heavy chain, axonemal
VLTQPTHIVHTATATTTSADATTAIIFTQQCFEGIKSVDFTADNTIVAMNSAEGEKVPFLHPVDPRGKSVEAWMSEVCAAMCASVREQVRLGVIDYAAAPRTQWMQQWPGQVVLNGSQVSSASAVVVVVERMLQRVHAWLY